MIKLAEKYAGLLKTEIIKGAFKENKDGSLTFVLVSGPKLSMTEQQLRGEIARLEKKANLPAQVEEQEVAKTPAKKKGA
jgi:hypothetical protein